MHNQHLFVYLFLLTGVMSSANNSENEMSSVEAAHSTTSSYDDEGKLHIMLQPKRVILLLECKNSKPMIFHFT